MTAVKQPVIHKDSSHSPCERKYNLLRAITIELIVFGILFTWLNIYLEFWIIAAVLFIGTCISIVNLILLRKKSNLILCGHIINSLCLLIMIIGNFCLGGISSTYFGWFYISPILAAATIGLDGLILYSLFSASVVLIFMCLHIPTIYSINSEYLPLINNVNHIFIFLLIITILYNLLKENNLYETLLEEQNFLLYSDKKKFHYLSHHDALTNLPNRSYFNTHLQEMIDLARTSKNTLTLYFMDLDGFKKINDKYGHEIGDMLLLQVGKRLQNCFREKDFIARLGGDEFTALISYTFDAKLPDVIMKRIKREFTESFHIKNLELKCSISIGMANFPADASDAESLLNLADNNMYKNKKMTYMRKENNL